MENHHHHWETITDHYFYGDFPVSYVELPEGQSSIQSHSTTIFPWFSYGRSMVYAEPRTGDAVHDEQNTGEAPGTPKVDFGDSVGEENHGKSW